MHIEFKAYPKCECGNDLVPIIGDEKIDPDYTTILKPLLNRKFLIWKCPKCKKIVDIKEKEN